MLTIGSNPNKLLFNASLFPCGEGAATSSGAVDAGFALACNTTARMNVQDGILSRSMHYYNILKEWWRCCICAIAQAMRSYRAHPFRRQIVAATSRGSLKCYWIDPSQMLAYRIIVTVQLEIDGSNPKTSFKRRNCAQTHRLGMQPVRGSRTRLWTCLRSVPSQYTRLVLFIKLYISKWDRQVSY